MKKQSTMSFRDEIIDLTDSFTLANHCALADFIIELDEESYIQNETSLLNVDSSLETTSINNIYSIDNSHTLEKKGNKKKKSTSTKKQNSHSTSLRKPIIESSIKFGDCPICCEELGTNPLASTKCGHVYCLKCLERCLKTEKKCPTCRRILKGNYAYHPLFLGNS
ncbi:uncharacterized RING finger protein C548.05c-like [Bombyx mandarina]|uniref:Uncharacterized RING finger protein C548.05c-like n=1 Tax=Bombyx mandarina TaxID=7092 RepID=A0A6J2KGH5_BOMMA|nr:uncharacterized RING finger protein C548.05c-like [Bombyx mandarina]